MAANALATEGEPGAPEAVPVYSSRIRGWLAGVVASALLVVALGYLTSDEIRADNGFDRAHASLDVTRHHDAQVRSELSAVRSSLREVDGEVDQDQAVLTRDTTELTGVQSSLSIAGATISRQKEDIGDLQSCLSGVEQALNALAVHDQPHAIDALDAVTATCSAAVDAGG